MTPHAGDRLRWFDVRRDRPLRAAGRFLCEGPLVVDALLASRFACETVLVAERKAEAYAHLPQAVVASEAEVRRLTGFDFHRGVMAVGLGDVPATLPPVSAGLVLALDRVEDAENVGSLLRLAAGFGCAGVLLGPGTHDPLYRRVIRVSMGHALRLPMARVADLPAAIAAVGGRAVAAALTPDAVPLRTLAPEPGVTTLVVGNEAHGVSAETLAACDVAAMIPMAGGVDSLNVAVAAGIFLHQLATAS